MQDSKLSKCQTNACCRLLERVLIDLRSLLREGRHRQAPDLADAAHNAVSVYHRGGLHGEYAGGEEA